MTAKGGYGLTMSLNGTAVVGVLDTDFPSFMKYIAESTGHDSPGGYYESVDVGKRRIEPMRTTLAWDVNEATHAAILTAFASTTAPQWDVADPDGDESIQVLMHVERIARISRQEDTYQAEVDLHPTGTATIT